LRRPNGGGAVVVVSVVVGVVGVVGVGRAEKASTITTATTTAATTAHRAIGKIRADGDLVIVAHHLHADESMAIGVQLPADNNPCSFFLECRCAMMMMCAIMVQRHHPHHAGK